VLAIGSEERYFLRLYVAGATARSRQALRLVYQLCEANQTGNYELEVIDVYQHPELAREHQIVATPTLIRSRPMPVRRYIGNMSNTEGLFSES
jgi:circadian clock protein KaiB